MLLAARGWRVRANFQGRNINPFISRTSPRLLVAAVGAAITLSLASSVTYAQPGIRPAPPANPAAAPARAVPIDEGKQPATREPSKEAAPTPGAPGDEELVTLSAFAEPVELSALVEMAANTLKINISTQGTIPGTVVFNAAVPVKKSELLGLLETLLDQQNFTIYKDRYDLYVVKPKGEIGPRFIGSDSTTRIIPTPNMRPSSLQNAINAQLGQGNAGQQISYIDELGVIIVTGPNRKLTQIEELITSLMSQYGKTQFIRLELVHISASVARERALQLIGQSSGSRAGEINPNQGGIPNAGGSGAGGNFSNLADRITIDPAGNALIFRGLPVEIQQVEEVLKVIDLPNSLKPKQYFAGTAARQIADIARQRGLGDVTTIATSNNNTNNNFQENNFIDPRTGQAGSRSNSPFVGGSVMVVDEGRGTILYYGTPAQQTQLDTLIKELDTKSEKIVINVYKLKHSDAEKVSEVILNLIQNTTPVGDSPLLPDGSSAARFTSGINRNRTTRSAPRDPNNPTSGEEEGLSLDGEGFVIADKSNNQILVKAAAGLQPDFAKLIEKLDLRRPQVYVEAKIVAVTADDRTRLAFESQLINSNGSGGVFNTNFGLGTLPTTGTQPILNGKTVGTGLGGFTAALIKSDQIPIIMTALANTTDSRVVSAPQLLVDDNEEANVVSLDQQPYTTTNLGGGTTGGSRDVTTFGGYAEAGTKLKITPQIASGDYLRLKYEIELSSFTGDASANTPPPKQTNNIDSASITVPTDSTVVVGGLVVDSKTNTVAKIPFLGDIPLFGALFKDDRKGDRKTTLYVFITPRIMRDPNFADLRLVTRGPQSSTNLGTDLPTMKPNSIDMVQSPDARRPGLAPSTIPTPTSTPAEDSAPQNQQPASTNPALPTGVPMNPAGASPGIVNPTPSKPEPQPQAQPQPNQHQPAPPQPEDPGEMNPD